MLSPSIKPFYPTNNRIFIDATTEGRMYFHSVANPHNPCNPEFQLLKYAQKCEVMLEPGDVLWIPPFMRHQVENVTNSIGGAYKFADIPAALRSSKVLTALVFLATKLSLFSHFFVSLFKNDVYILTKEQGGFD